MKKNFIPFTKEHYPQGYSRKDCQEQLATVESQIDGAKKQIRKLTAEAKELRKKLKQGGKIEL